MDDYILSTPASTISLSSCMLVIFCLLFHVPISWKKCKLSPQVLWIGWQVDFSAGLVELDDAKRQKLLFLIQEMFTHSRVPKKTLEKFVGHCVWCMALFPHMKPALQPLCVNLLSFPPTHHGVPPALWTVLKTCLDESAPDPARRIHFRGEQADFGAACAYSHPFGS